MDIKALLHADPSIRMDALDRFIDAVRGGADPGDAVVVHDGFSDTIRLYGRLVHRRYPWSSATERWRDTWRAAQALMRACAALRATIAWFDGEDYYRTIVDPLAGAVVLSDAWYRLAPPDVEPLELPGPSDSPRLWLDDAGLQERVDDGVELYIVMPGGYVSCEQDERNVYLYVREGRTPRMLCYRKEASYE